MMNKIRIIGIVFVLLGIALIYLNEDNHYGFWSGALVGIGTSLALVGWLAPKTNNRG